MTRLARARAVPCAAARAVALTALTALSALTAALGACDGAPDVDRSDAGVEATDAGSDASDAGNVEDAGSDVDTEPLWVGTVRRERSLAWTDAAILDDASAVGLSRTFGAAASAVSTSPGGLLDAWLRRFATTPHSERAAPARLADQLRAQLGADPALWDVDDAPFRATAVHNRTDLMNAAGDAGGPHCGELRVSYASTDPLIRPFHVLFLFRQPAIDGDVDVNGALTCERTALRWAELSDVDDADFASAARAMLDEALVAARFLMIESVELTVSPWEWRQWAPTSAPSGSVTLENPALFQQVDVERVNAPGALRDDFLAFVEDNANALRERSVLIPARFRSPSIRVAQGVPWVPLDLTGAELGDDENHDEVRRNIEIVGCTACHTADASFVQTRDDRTFSPFYTKELAARGELLSEMMQRRRRAIPFGPLQASPVLPP